MDQCLTDLMDRGEQINQPGFMINHIMRIATTPRAYDLGYGFLLTRVFEHFGVELRKKVAAQVIDEIGSSTIMGCGFVLIKVGDRRTNQEHLLCLRLFAVEIKVFKHLQCLFLAPLPASQLLPQLLQIRDFGLIFLHCSVSSRRRKS